MTGFTLKKSMMERYDIGLNNEDNWRCAWAMISISNDGFLSIQSDCGDFSYKWSSFGDCFKSFLLRINDGYLYNKIASKKDVVNVEETVKQFKESLLEKRRNKDIDEDDALYAWGEIQELIDESHEVSPDSFHGAIGLKSWLNDALPELYDDFHITYEPDRAAQTFCEVVMPVFVEILKSELAEELARKK